MCLPCDHVLKWTMIVQGVPVPRVLVARAKFSTVRLGVKWHLRRCEGMWRPLSMWRSFLVETTLMWPRGLPCVFVPSHASVALGWTLWLESNTFVWVLQQCGANGDLVSRDTKGKILMLDFSSSTPFFMFSYFILATLCAFTFFKIVYILIGLAIACKTL
jgi:hypothetical protein